jgi:outer membrane protein, heavy metal efflux system
MSASTFAADRSPRTDTSARVDVPTSAAHGSDLSDELANAAVLANPTLQAIEDRVGALEQRVLQARIWLDPIFSAEYSNMPIDDPAPGQHPMSGIQFMLRQTFYWPGKIGAREGEAKSRVIQEQLSLAERKVQLRATVKRAYFRLALTRQLRDVTRQHVRLVSDFMEVVRIKVETGVGAQHELLRLRVLVDQLSDDLKSLDRDEAGLTAAINATLHRAIDVEVPTPERTVVQEPTTDAMTLAQQAEHDRPLLKRLAAEAETYRSAARRARREGYPDLTLWAGYRVRTRAGADPGTDFMSLGVSLPLPFSYDERWGSEGRQNEQMAAAVMQDREATLDRMRGDLGGIVADWKRSAQKARTYRDELIPEARMSLDASLASYRVGRADFASLFQAELELLNFERTTLMAATDAAEARVAAEEVVGSGVR